MDRYGRDTSETSGLTSSHIQLIPKSTGGYKGQWVDRPDDWIGAIVFPAKSFGKKHRNYSHWLDSFRSRPIQEWDIPLRQACVNK